MCLTSCGLVKYGFFLQTHMQCSESCWLGLKQYCISSELMKPGFSLQTQKQASHQPPHGCGPGAAAQLQTGQVWVLQMQKQASENWKRPGWMWAECWRTSAAAWNLLPCCRPEGTGHIPAWHATKAHSLISANSLSGMDGLDMNMGLAH